MSYAKRAGFITRAQAGLKAPRSRSRAITPLGVVWHWIGVKVSLSSHSRCITQWRNIQRVHMAPGGLGAKNGASDIAYTFGVCPHGYVLAGRGAGVRTGANGTTYGNQNFYAICALMGPGNVLTPEMLQAILWGTLELQRVGGAGKRIIPHKSLTGTACPGNDLIREIPKYNGKSIPTKPETVVDPWEEFWMALSPQAKKAGEDFLEYIAKEVKSDRPGRSFAFQTLKLIRDEDGTRSDLESFVEGLRDMGTTPRTLGRVLVALVRAARAEGWDINPDLFKLNAEYRFDDGELQVKREVGNWYPVVIDNS